MPAPDASFAAIVAALAGHYGQPDPIGVRAGLDPFPALVGVLLARVADPAKAARALETLADAGLLEPGTLAGADINEIHDALKSNGVNVPLRGLASIPRLSRWYAERVGP